MMIEKKGQTGTMVGILAFVATTIVLFVVLIKPLQGQDINKQDMICAGSVLTSITQDVFALNCPVAEIECSKNDVEGNDCFRIVAERMRKCWENFGQGENREFNRAFIGDGDVVCNLCAEVEFSDNVRQSSVENFRNYLRTTDMLLSNKKYSDFLYPKLNDDFDEIVVDTLNTNGKYYMMYQVYNPARVDIPLFSKLKENSVTSAVFFLSRDDFSSLRCEI